ncbi:MAG TPA: NAD-dependent epimerase/dehydratase family protein [Casimicrobiaceae bacterium]|nr:NAD-dependent epimerase/dehydratase family protein [Casimicrobiaceae bacterium]
MRVLVLGGNGFAGRHVVAALRAQGHRVVVGSRRGSENPTAVDSGTLRTHFAALVSPARWQPLVEGFDCVVNCVGILRPRWRESYDAVHHLAPAALARACASTTPCIRLVHVSALGLSDRARSGFIRSKLDGERAIASSGGASTIVRPSLLDGEGGYGARWLRCLAKAAVHFVPHNAVGRIAVLDVSDLGLAIARICEMPPERVPAVCELGGADLYTMEEYLAALRASQDIRGRAVVVHLPSLFARAVSHLFDASHFSPFSFGHYELMQTDNVPARNALPSLLGRDGRRQRTIESGAQPPPRARARSTSATRASRAAMMRKRSALSN